MKNNKNQFSTTRHKRLVGILIAVAILLLIPFIAMQFIDAVNWDLTDFFVMGILLLGTGLLCELAMRKVKNTEGRAVVCALILLAFFLIWAELAVGILGSPFAGN